MEKDLNKIKENMFAYDTQSFYVASNKLYELRNEDYAFSNYLIPCAVNSAFTIELAIKTLLISYNIDFVKIHYLDELYLLLPSNDLPYILFNIKQKYYSNFDNQYVVNKMFSISEYFQKVRYIGEYTQVINIFDIRAFMDITYNFMLNKCGVKVEPLQPLIENSLEFNTINKLIMESEQKEIANRKEKIIIKKSKPIT